MDVAVPAPTLARSSTLFWSPWLRWAFGVVGPVYCFATVLFVLAGDPLFIAPRTAMLLFAGCCVLAQILATCRPARGGPPAGLLGGMLATGAVFALAYAAILAPALGLAFSEPQGVLVLLPAPAAYVYLRASIQEFRSGTRGGMLGYLLAVLAGVALPFAVAYAGHSLALQVEARVVARCVDVRDCDLARLESWRAVSWLHDWPQLEELAQTAVTSGESGSAQSRSGRAALAFEALTGRAVQPARKQP